MYFRSAFALLVSSLLVSCDAADLQGVNNALTAAMPGLCASQGRQWNGVVCMPAGSGGARVAPVNTTAYRAPAPIPYSPPRSVASPLPASTPATTSPSANNCISSSINPNSTAFFKGRITNRCTRSVTVRWCEAASCSTNASYYNNLETVRPGASIPVDTVGRGVRFAACFALDGSLTNAPVSTGNAGQFYCR